MLIFSCQRTARGFKAGGGWSHNDTAAVNRRLYPSRNLDTLKKHPSNSQYIFCRFVAVYQEIFSKNFSIASNPASIER